MRVTNIFILLMLATSSVSQNNDQEIFPLLPPALQHVDGSVFGYTNWTTRMTVPSWFPKEWKNWLAKVRDHADHPDEASDQLKDDKPRDQLKDDEASDQLKDDKPRDQLKDDKPRDQLKDDKPRNQLNDDKSRDQLKDNDEPLPSARTVEDGAVKVMEWAKTAPGLVHWHLTGPPPGLWPDETAKLEDKSTSNKPGTFSSPQSYWIDNSWNIAFGISTALITLIYVSGSIFYKNVVHSMAKASKAALADEKLTLGALSNPPTPQETADHGRTVTARVTAEGHLATALHKLAIWRLAAATAYVWYYGSFVVAQIVHMVKLEESKSFEIGYTANVMILSVFVAFTGRHLTGVSDDYQSLWRTALCPTLDTTSLATCLSGINVMLAAAAAVEFYNEKK